MFPKQTIEVIPMQDGTFMLRLYNATLVTLGSATVPEGRVAVTMKAYASLNLMIVDLKAMIAAIPA